MTITAEANCTGHLLMPLAGEIDLATAPSLREKMIAATTDASSLVVIDLSEVSFLDSVGISVLVGGHRRLSAEGRRMHLASPLPRVQRVLEITRISSLIPTFGTLDEAVAGCPLPHVA